MIRGLEDMIELFYGENKFGSITDKRFLEINISEWINSPKRMAQLLAERYYRGEHDILKKTREMIGKDGKMHPVKYLPNNRIVDNQYRRLVDQITNFEAGQPITFDTDLSTTTGQEFAELLGKLFGKQAMRRIKYVIRHAVNEGISWLYVWEDKKNQTLAFSIFQASEVLPFWADSEHEKLDCALRLFTVEDYGEDGKKKFVSKVEVFDKVGIHTYNYTNGALIEDYDTPVVPYLQVTVGDNVVPYTWQRCPLIPFRRGELEQTLLSVCKQLQDTLNQTHSDFHDALQENCKKSTLVVKNYQGTKWDEFLHNLHTLGIIPVRTTEGGEGGVEVLKIDIDANTYKSVVDLIKRAMVEACGGFDAKDDRLGSNPNQMNIESMYADIEITANDLESEFSASFEQLLWFVRQYLAQTNKDNTEGIDFQKEKAEVIFNRDMMVNETEVIQNCANSVDLISRETILKNHSWVDNPKAEMDRLRDEHAEDEKAADSYNKAFGDHNHDDQKDEVTGDEEEQ